MNKLFELSDIFELSFQEDFNKYQPIFTFTTFKRGYIWVVLFSYCKYTQRILVNRYDINNKNIQPLYVEDAPWLLQECYKTLLADNDYNYVDNTIILQVIGHLKNFIDKNTTDKKIILKKTKQKNINSALITSDFLLNIDELYLINSKINLPYGRMLANNTSGNLNEINLSTKFGLTIKDQKERYIAEYGFIVQKKSTQYYHLANAFDEFFTTKVGHQTFGDTSIHAPIRSILGSMNSDNNINFSGFEENEKPLTFNVIIGLNNTSIIGAEPLSISDSLFFMSKNDLAKRFESNIDNIIEIFPNSETFICIKVIDTDKDTAYKTAKEKLDKIIYFLNIENKNDNYFELYNNSNRENNWFFYTKNQNIEMSTAYFVEEEAKPESYYAFDTKAILPFQLLELHTRIEGLINENKWIKEFISDILSDNQDRILKKIVESLKWISLSWKTDNVNEKVFFTNTAMEYFSSFTTQTKRVNKKEMKSLISLINTTLEDSAHHELISDIDRIIQNSINSHSFLETINNFFKSIDIELTDENIEDLKTTRKYRNQLTHGDLVDKKDSISVDTIYSVNRIIAKALFRKIKYIYNEKG